jgi:hypothetical protein
MPSTFVITNSSLQTGARIKARFWLACASFWLAASASTAAIPETAADPTRPPDAWLALQSQASSNQDDSEGARITVVGKSQRFAVVDGQLVKVGDVVHGLKVLAIRSSTVTVRENGHTRVLSLTPDVVKKNQGKP